MIKEDGFKRLKKFRKNLISVSLCWQILRILHNFTAVPYLSDKSIKLKALNPVMST